MTYAYRIFQGNNNPAPCIEVEITSPSDQKRRVFVEALLDTGSDSTFVPLRLLQRIRVSPNGRAEEFGGACGSMKSLPHLVSLTINHQFLESQTVWGWDRDFVLIGRDVLNQKCIELDGINLIFTFSQ